MGRIRARVSSDKTCFAYRNGYGDYIERYSNYQQTRFECNICSFVKIRRCFDLQAELKAHIRAMYANQMFYRKFLAEANPISCSSHGKEPDVRDMKKIY